MKILHFDSSYKVAGVETFLHDLAIHQALNNEVKVILSEDKRIDYIGRSLIKNGCSVECWFNKSTCTLNRNAVLKAIIAIRKTDVIHVHQDWFGANIFLLILLSLIAFKKTIITEQIKCHFDPPILIRFIRSIVNLRLVAVSDSVRSNLSKLLRRNITSIKVIPNGLDIIALRKRARVENANKLSFLSNSKQSLTIGYVGRLVEQKNILELIYAVSDIIHQDGLNIKLLILGEGNQRELLSSISKQLGLLPFIHFLGFLDNPAPIMEKFDIFILPSKYEGTPVALLEAMALGLPIVVSAVDGSLEVMKRAKSGFCLTKTNRATIRYSLIELLNNKQLRVKYGKQSRIYVEAKHDISIIAGKYSSLYQEMYRTI